MGAVRQTLAGGVLDVNRGGEDGCEDDIPENYRSEVWGWVREGREGRWYLYRPQTQGHRALNPRLDLIEKNYRSRISRLLLRIPLEPPVS